MMRALLVRGLIAGLVAGIAAFVFAFFVGEPHVEAAIALEEAAAEAHGHGAAEEAIVSRDVQRTFGLFVAQLAPAIAIGGLFSIAFAFIYGRFGSAGLRAHAALLAAGAFVAVSLVPFLKYPANPPAVGDPDTIASRTGVYFVFLAISVLAFGLALYGARSLVERFGGWTAGLIAAAGYLVVVAVSTVALPTVNEVAGDFPATLLWAFRVSSLGNLAVLWAVLGVVFGALAHRVVAAAAEKRTPVAA